MLVEMQIKILDGQSSDLFSNAPFEKSPVMTIEDFVWHSDHHLKSCLLGNGLYLICNGVATIRRLLKMTGLFCRI